MYVIAVILEQNIVQSPVNFNCLQMLSPFLAFFYALIYTFLEPKRVIHPMDVAILVDTSEGISSIDFEREKNFVKSLVRSLTISSGLSRVSMMSYSNETDLTVNFSDQQTKASLLRRVDALPFLGGRPQIGQALETAAAQLFSPSGTARAAVPRTVVIVTTHCCQDRITGASRLNETVALLRRNGVKILVTAVCDDVDDEGLRTLVEDEEDIITAGSFEGLAAATEKVSAAASQVAGTFACTRIRFTAFLKQSFLLCSCYPLYKGFCFSRALYVQAKDWGEGTIRFAVLCSAQESVAFLFGTDPVHLASIFLLLVVFLLWFC